MVGEVGMTRTQIQEATAVLKGKPLWGCTRAADMASFDFGARRQVQGRRGTTIVGEYAFHVQCTWRITQEEELLVGSHDLFYPEDYEDDSKDLPPDFDWDRDPTRRDKLIRLLFDNGTREFIVQTIQVGAAGSLHIALSDGISLDVFPDRSLVREHWRLFRPGVDERHFVFTGWEIKK